MKPNGWPSPPAFDRFKTFGHDDLTANIVIFGCSGPPGTIDGIKNFNKGNQATKH